MRSLVLFLPLAALGIVAARPDDPKKADDLKKTGEPKSAWASDPAKAVAKPTYAKDVASIVNRACVSCHQTGEVAPFSLAGFENAKKWKDMMASVAKTRQMPPWKAAPGYGEFQHENRLSDAEIQTLANWAATGAPRGDKRLEPALPKPPVGGWTLGRPDLTIQGKAEYRLDAEGEDVYRNFVVHNPLDKALWVRAMDVHPGNKKIVHHVIVYVDGMHQGQKLSDATKDGQDGYVSSGGGVGFMPTGALGGWAPGLRPYETPQGQAMRVPAGADLVIQVHYHKSGKPEKDLTNVGLYLAKEPIEKEVRLAWIANFGIDIPPNDKAYAAHKEYTIRQDLTLHSLMPHMHLLGRSMRAKAVTPDGREIPLIDVPSWDFNWQLNYALKRPLALPKDSKILVDAVYDNSAANPHNPSSPPRRVGWGEETMDEMFLLIAAYTVDAENLGRK